MLIFVNGTIKCRLELFVGTGAYLAMQGVQDHKVERLSVREEKVERRGKKEKEGREEKP